MSGGDLGKIAYWVEHYGSAGLPDQRALEDFINCETREMISVFQLQLNQVAGRQVDQVHVERIIGAKRLAVHGSAADWARVMLLWLSPLVRGS